MNLKVILFLVCFTSILMLSACSNDRVNLSKHSVSTQKDISFGMVDSPDLIKKTITLKNIGNYALSVKKQQINDDNFVVFTDSDITVLEPQQELFIQIIFTPTSTGIKTLDLDMNEWISIIDNTTYYIQNHIEFIDSNSNESFDGIISISGELLKYPLLDVDGIENNILDFGTTELNNPKTKNIIITNKGNDELIISNVEIKSYNNSFNILDNECNIIESNQACKIIIENIMQSIGGQQAELHIISNAVIDKEKIIILKSQSFSSDIILSEQTLQYDNIKIGAEQTKELNITNKGSQINISDINVGSNGFIIKNNSCDAVIDTNTTCKIIINFQPQQEIEYSGELTITGKNAISNDEINIKISLMGNGIIGKLLPSSAALNYGKINKGEVATKSITLKNIGKFPVNITGINIAQTFNNYKLYNHTCSNTLNYNDECKIDIQFEPEQYGADDAFLIIDNDSVNDNIRIALYGTGSGTELTASNTINFGKVKNKTTKTIKLQNNGYDTIEFNTIEILDNNYFNIKSNFCSSIQRNDECNINIEFTPPYYAEVSDKLKIIYNKNNEFYINLIGEGISPQAEVSVTNNMDFGSVPVLSSINKNITITNNGSDNLVLDNIKLLGTEFFLSQNNCSIIAPHQQCVMTVKYTPKNFGVHTGILTFNTNDKKLPFYQIEITGKAIYKGAYLEAPNEYELAGLTGSERHLYLRNIGNEILNISNIIINYDQYGSQIITDDVNDCLGELKPNQSCSIKFNISGHGSGLFDIIILSNSVGEYEKQILVNYNI